MIPDTFLKKCFKVEAMFIVSIMFYFKYNKLYQLAHYFKSIICDVNLWWGDA